MRLVDISIFVPTLNGGGAERVAVLLANAFASRGFAVDLVLAKCVGPYLSDVTSNVRVIDLNAKRVANALWPLAQYLRREKPKAMLSVMGHANVVALLAKALARAPTRLVVSEHGLISGEHAIAKGFSARLNFLLIPFLYRFADGICSVSKAASLDFSEFTGISESLITTIYNPFDLEKINNLALEPLLHPWFQSNQPPVVLAIGRLNEAKDFSTLIRAFSKLSKIHTVRLVILGEGELRVDLENLVAQLSLRPDQVQLVGFVDNPFAWLARCSLFVLSSRREALSNTLIEAMACGVPVLSTNCLSGPSEILGHGIWGKLVPVGDANALAQGMAETLDLPPEKRPNVRLRAADFDQGYAVASYLQILGMPSKPIFDIKNC